MERDYNAIETATRMIRVLGPRTVQATRSHHWYGHTIVVRVRNPGGTWHQLAAIDLPGVQRWDPAAANKIGGQGALVTDPVPQAEIDAAVCKAAAILARAEADGKIAAFLAEVEA